MEASVTQAGAKYWSQMVFAGEPLTRAVRKVQVIPEKHKVIGIMTQ
jgi:hypothetical protein